jgi:signal transduction histidine kinase
MRLERCGRPGDDATSDLFGRQRNCVTVTAVLALKIGQPTRGDVALGASLLVVAVLSGSYIDAARPDTIEPSSWWHWSLLCTPPVLVAIRRLEVVLVTIVATATQATIWVSGLPEVLLSLIVILYTAASEGGRRGVRTAVLASVVLTGVTAVGVRIAEDVTPYQLPLIVLTCGTAIALGVSADRQRAATAALATEVAELRLRSEYERAAVIADERNRVARELHDIIGHSLSTIAVRAEAADRVADQRPAAAREAVAAIAIAARSALDETRRVLAGLRRSGEVELAPPPDLGALRSLVDRLAQAGVDATIVVDGCDDRPLPPVTVGGAHRIVQESLTNAVRHGGAGVSIVVTIACRDGSLDITVADDGPGRATTPGTADGSGLTGMAERAIVLGGTFEAGDRPGGGFAVHAVLPTTFVTSTHLGTPITPLPLGTEPATKEHR